MKYQNGHYIVEEDYTYYSKRYNRSVTIIAPYKCDGASGWFVPDLHSRSWQVHDWVCEFKVWDDGSKCTHVQRSMILHDILESENRWFRAVSWSVAVFICQPLYAKFKKQKT